MRATRRMLASLVLAGLVAGSGELVGQAPGNGGVFVFTNGRVITADGAKGFEPQNLTMLVRDGRIERLAPAQGFRAPESARVVDLAGAFVTPGFINTHAHVSDVNGLKPRAYTEDNARRQLALYARYGITTVWSLGGEQAPAFVLRDAQSSFELSRARIFVSGDVITGKTADDARQAVARVAATKPDIIKIRVDDNLGSTTKMPPDVYRAVIDEAHARGLRVAAHIFYLDDAKALLRAGVDMIAHSVRDRDLDDETVALLKSRNVPYCPTLTREVSTFAYEATPRFFDDPFFLKEADRDVMAQLQQPARQQAMAASKSAQAYKAGLEVAKRNLKKAADAGVLIAMGTDSGASAERFQGFFEHLEMQMMAESGLTPVQVLRSATADAARAARHKDLGTIAPGSWADFAVFSRNPAESIANTKSLSAVYVRGNPVR